MAKRTAHYSDVLGFTVTMSPVGTKLSYRLSLVGNS
jgi:hypothetical protein